MFFGVLGPDEPRFEGGSSENLRLRIFLVCELGSSQAERASATSIHASDREKVIHIQLLDKTIIEKNQMKGCAPHSIQKQNCANY